MTTITSVAAEFQEFAKRLDEEFGPGTAELTRPISRRSNIKLLFQINQMFKDPAKTQPYSGENILNTLQDFEDQGITPDQYELVALIHGEGWRQALNNNASQPHEMQNPFQAEMEDLLQRGITVYFCLNTARKKSVKIHQVIPGIKFVTAGITALADFQHLGYNYIQP